MLIDWFTVGAQALNFIVLVWLMKRFLYRPVLDAIDAREKRIASQLADAAAQEARARTERDGLQQKSDAFDQQRAALLAQATTEAGTERDRLLTEARSAADSLSAKRQEALNGERDELNRVFIEQARHEVFAIARKTLGDLAGASLEERMVDTFNRRLRTIDGPTKDQLAAALASSPDAALVRTTFELPAEQRTAIQNALDQTFSTSVRLRFETAPDLVSGIELGCHGQKLAWSISAYLASLEQAAGALLAASP